MGTGGLSSQKEYVSCGGCVSNLVSSGQSVGWVGVVISDCHAACMKHINLVGLEWSIIRLAPSGESPPLRRVKGIGPKLYRSFVRQHFSIQSRVRG